MQQLLTPEEFVAKWPKLKVDSAVSFGKVSYWVSKSKKAETCWRTLCSLHPSLKIDHSLFKGLNDDLNSVGFYYRAWATNVTKGPRYTLPAPPKNVKSLLVKWSDLFKQQQEILQRQLPEKGETAGICKSETPILNVLIEICTLYLVVTCQVESTGCLLVEYEQEVDRGGAFRIGDFEKYTQAFQRIALQHLQASRKRYIEYLIG